MNPANKESGTPTYCHYSEAYPFVNYQNQKIYQDFDKFCLFKPFFLSNLVDRNDHIDISFYLDNDYVAPSGVAVYRNSDGTYNRNIAVPFWVAIETLTFGEILRLLHYLQEDVLVASENTKASGTVVYAGEIYQYMFDEKVVAILQKITTLPQIVWVQ